ncbi:MULTISPECIES: L-aspartate oxidase [unclassified Corallococcus]|uniref:L-aspartate oxidase n=1 Tax=unclassified Corallococcus TaxID=2685029 RepID=UPI001A90BCC7|nr:MULTISPECIES: L-aspartate oxidase [unclassified Corallococcus]MBN9684517.1 L-aspartate oxidase [Corallococcus sp. NCSPR001]WAS84009.1 L-aspartate oxidase [Corallococcus sp. NCRR]
MPHRFDFLVMGGGVAGLSFALQAARHGTVAVLTKRERGEGNTAYAQGGIAGVLSPTDSFDAHIDDTLVAGAGLCHRDAVEVTVREGPARLKELVALGAAFDQRGGEFDLTREGGHSARRIIHAGDVTGREVQRALLAACDEQPNITFFQNTAAIDLILDRRPHAPAGSRCLGVYALMEDGSIERFLSKVTVLATGGAGKVYLYTSNPDVATGDGVAMAYRAGARVANMEFYQFHPTCLFHPEAKSFLISEALRGEGGKLRLKGGQTFMDRYHPMKDLAPRDVVARAIDAELKRTGNDCVYLDMTHLGRAYLTERFPNIYATCKAFNIDMAVQPIPVVPAAHYQCGGVVTDLHGRTNIPGLYAIGEVSCTGLHGANRLASNSLLEGLVFGHRAVQVASEELASLTLPKEDPPAWDSGSAVDSDESVVVTHNWDEIRRLMWNYVGIVRTDKRLMRARRRLELLREEIRDYYWRFKVTRDVIELRNIAEVAHLIVDCASRRKESRGLHYTLDYPHTDEHQGTRDTVLSREL